MKNWLSMGVSSIATMKDVDERDRHGQRQRANELAGGARKHQERQERTDDGQGRGKHGNRKLGGAAPCRFLTIHAVIEQLDVVIRDHDGVVHHHPEHHDQRGDRHLVQFDAEGVQQAEGRRDGHRNRHRGNQRHAERQQQHR